MWKTCLNDAILSKNLRVILLFIIKIDLYIVRQNILMFRVTRYYIFQNIDYFLLQISYSIENSP